MLHMGISLVNKPIHYATKRLKAWRDDRDWSQQQLADFLTLQLGKQVTRSTVQKWENQERGIVADQALMISKALSIPVMELVERKNV